MPIPHDDGTIRTRVAALVEFLNQQGWKFDTQLHVLLSFIFHAARSRDERKRMVVEWLREVTRDLEAQ